MNNKKTSSKAVILAMHGSPPRDFPKRELAEFFDLHMKLENMPQMLSEKEKQRCHELEEKIRNWPRTEQNDPFFTSSKQIAALIGDTINLKTFVGFNEFCNPSIIEALTTAIAENYTQLFVITPMMTPGGEHSEHDIPHAIEKVKKEHPEVTITYVWPFELQEVAEFLVEQLKGYM